MTQITLRQAHKLVEKINARLATITINPSKSLNVWEVSDASQAFNDATTEFNNDIERQLRLVHVRADIRDAIRISNTLVVDDLVAKRKRALDVIGTLRHINTLADARGVASAAALAEKVEAVRASAKNTARTYGDNDEITISLMSSAQLKDLDKQIQARQLEIEQIEDDLTAANSSGKIMLGEKALAVLRDEGLI